VSATKRTPMQRAASLMPLPPLMAELGLGMETVLAGTGVMINQLRPDAFIPYAAYSAILDNAARLSGRDDIGSLLGRRQTLAALGPLGDVMRHAATLGEAIAAFAAFQIRNSTGGAVYLVRSDRDVILGYGIYDPMVRASHHIYDMVLAVGCNLVAELTQGSVGPAEVFSLRQKPGDPAQYQRIGRCPVRFGQNQTGLVLARSSLAFRLPEADIDLHERALARLAANSDTSLLEMRAQVRHLLRPFLLMGRGRMEDIASRLSVQPRTMRRRLKQEGTTFEAIKDEVRYAAARELLMLGVLSITDIAVTLDYASASSFVDAFRRWSGLSPGLWRKTRHLDRHGLA
jgi:AraC-like DNA-binding protein